MKKRDAIILAIIMLIIIIGIILTCTIGFKKQLRFSDSQKIDIYVGYVHNDAYVKIKDIANEVIGNKNMVQIIEIYGDMVTIRANSITEEQKNTIVNKTKELYEFEQTAENTNVENIPATRIRDILKQYVLPLTIAGAIILGYMLITYHKKGLVKVMLNTILIPIILELLLFSILVITRIPVGIYTPSLILLVLVLAITYVVCRIQKLPEKNV